MNSRIRAAAVVAVVLAAFLSACSTETGGTAVPSSSGASTATSEANPDVPKVAQPLNASAYAADPCKLMPQSTLTELRFVDPGTPHTAAAPDTKAGPYCGWIVKGEGAGLQVSLLTGNRDNGMGGLAGIYGGHASGQFAFLEKTEDVDGYPAVFADRKDRRAGGNCNMYVGIADDLVFGAYALGYQGAQDSCQAAQQAAAAVVKTLKGA